MLTIDAIAQYCEQEIARLQLAGDREELRRLQLAIGVIMKAAEQVRDRETAMRFRVLAARAANAQELIAGED
ncbi:MULTISPECIES: hypothetical protein [Chloroflexus]|jgi:hypothetical protein|uniref:Uncharacterized protein n=1 Tax=Chloroflexus aggregans (strain MD-66 / DSM 9485) TaxID=326427 RepID=B8GC21_CHLAD|nr:MULTISPECIES: hypothetical protein [Chloroflexus]ACL22995.1 conserved hypothetical protein [Chloroflexus aggregans DSM 9485]GIV89582.1 MAG: hypothetical protein KatS3mg055_2100 [Chloroflexus sp.]